MPVEIRIPAMGEGITDVTITRWLIKENEKVTKDSPLVEIATDKVDSEILAPEDGKLDNILYNEGDIVKIGESIATLYEEATYKNQKKSGREKQTSINNSLEAGITGSNAVKSKETKTYKDNKLIKLENKRFVSPFIRSIALQKGISITELDNIPGSGLGGRLTKDDILHYNTDTIPEKNIQDNDAEYVELSRMRKVIAKNMLYSKQISPHVTSFVEVNLTKISKWRNANKNLFLEKYGEKITYLPFVIQATAKALKEFPHINASLDNEQLIVKKNINIGIATALADGNLIVPVIKKADNLNLAGITKSLNSYIKKARESTLQPEDITGGTFTITNIGTFGNIGGTPIINQPQLAILAVGEIVKKPVAVKTEENYGIAIQDIAELWLSYDHRIVDGFMGGSFLKRIATLLEQFDESIVF